MRHLNWLLTLTLGFVSVSSLDDAYHPKALAAQNPAAAPTQEVSYRKLVPGVWLHTSSKEMPKWGKVISNGLVVEAGDHSLLVDTAWNDSQTAEILEWAQQHLGKPITQAVFTHAHEDKMGGVAVLRQRGVQTFASLESNMLAPAHGLTPAAETLRFDKQGLSAQLAPLVVLDPGPGHTLDNIVVGLPEQGIVFGGCLIRPGGTDNLGNTAEADIGHWAAAVRAVADQFPLAQVVVPSHGPPAGRELFELTRQLAEQAAKDAAPDASEGGHR